MATIDVAMESTSQQILSAVQSSGDINSANTRMITNTITNTEQTLLDISGSGYLLCSTIYNICINGSYNQLKITVDGEVVFYVKVTNSANSNVQRGILAGSKEFVFINDSNIYLPSPSGNTAIPFGIVTSGTGSELKTITKSSNSCDCFPMTPIRFKQSLKVEVTTTGTNTGAVSVVYALD